MTLLNQALLTNGSAAGSSVAWSGGYCAVSCEATFAGGSVILEAQSANGTWITVGTYTTFTTNGWGGAFLPPCNIRANVSGSPTSIYCYANQMPTPTSMYTMGN